MSCPFSSALAGQSATPDWIRTAFSKYKPNISAAPIQYSKPSSCTPDQWSAIAKHVVNSGVPPAKWMRVGFHTSATFDAASHTGGPNGGWHRYPEDATFPVNAGLEVVLDAARKIQAAFPAATFADLLTFGASVATEAGGGPPIAWYPGRLDSLSPGPSLPPYSARLPDASYNASGVITTYQRVGLTLREMVALTGGGHSMGGADAEASGWDGSFTSWGDSWPTPKNLYFRDFTQLQWVPHTVESTQRIQYVPAPGQATKYTDSDGGLVMRLPADVSLTQNKDMRRWVQAYADDEALFLADYQRTFQRLMQLGAGGNYELQSSAFHWKGLNGDFEGFGPDIEPLVDDHIPNEN